MPVTREEHPLPVILFHWVHVVTLFILIMTGFYIHHPFYPGWMQASRTLHLTFLWVFIFIAVVRVYWAFFGSGSAAIGSRHIVADYHWFMPIRRHPLWETLKYYLMLRCTHPTVVKYNSLQKLSYLMWLFLVVPMALTGFTIRPAPHPFFRSLAYMVGGIAAMRFIHYLLMWVFIITVAIHIYLAFIEGTREIPLMFWWRESIPEKRG